MKNGTKTFIIFIISLLSIFVLILILSSTEKNSAVFKFEENNDIYLDYYDNEKGLFVKYFQKGEIIVYQSHKDDEYDTVIYYNENYYVSENKDCLLTGESISKSDITYDINKEIFRAQLFYDVSNQFYLEDYKRLTANNKKLTFSLTLFSFEYHTFSLENKLQKQRIVPYTVKYKNDPIGTIKTLKDGLIVECNIDLNYYKQLFSNRTFNYFNIFTNDLPDIEKLLNIDYLNKI